MQFGINKHEQIFQRPTKLLEPVGRVQFGVFEKFTSAYLSQIALEIIWLLINNIHEKITRYLSSRNARVSRNQENSPSRACAWFESKRFDWPSVSFIDHWPIRMLGLFPVLHWINSFLHYFPKKKNCTAHNQSEWRNFFMIFIRDQNLCPSVCVVWKHVWDFTYDGQLALSRSRYSSTNLVNNWAPSFRCEW